MQKVYRSLCVPGREEPTSYASKSWLDCDRLDEKALIKPSVQMPHWFTTTTPEKIADHGDLMQKAERSRKEN